MIDRTTLRAVGRATDKQFSPEREAMIAEFSAGRIDAREYVGRMESLADRQADAVVNSVRPLLLRARLTPDGRRIVDHALAQIRAATRTKLLPNGMTLAEFDASEAVIHDIFADALEADDDE